MSFAVRTLLRLLLWCSSMISVCHCLAEATEPLLLVGQPAVEATFVGPTVSGKLMFDVAGVTQKVTRKELLRWSTQPSPLGHSELLLADGSRLVLADAWASQVPWQISESTISAATMRLGKVTLPRNQVQAIMINSPQGLNPQTKLLDEFLANKTEADSLRLINGDQWTGKLLGIEKQQEGPRQISFALETGGKPLQISESQVAAILFSSSETKALPLKKKLALEKRFALEKKLVIGLRDGSRLSADSLVADGMQLRVRLCSGIKLTGLEVRDIVSLQSFGPESVYLSDLIPSGYKSVPYLDIPHPYRRDRNVENGLLRVSKRTYTMGLGMHSSARLTFRLEKTKRLGRFRSFVADVAIDDLANQGGSVVFRVYLEQNGQWQQAFASPIVRGGDPPLAIRVELKNARQLALETDFADRGDEQDYANWLDARLE